jgi:hypothetical protein
MNTKCTYLDGVPFAINPVFLINYYNKDVSIEFLKLNSNFYALKY